MFTRVAKNALRRARNRAEQMGFAMSVFRGARGWDHMNEWVAVARRDPRIWMKVYIPPEMDEQARADAEEVIEVCDREVALSGSIYWLRREAIQ